MVHGAFPLQKRSKDMRLAAVALLGGVLVFQQLHTLPAPLWAWLLIVSVPLSFLATPLALLFWAINGFLLALLHATVIMSSALSPALIGEDILIEGVVASIPERKNNALRFEFKIERTVDEALNLADLPRRVRVSWYRDAPQMAVGQTWRLMLRLKPAHGFMNPGGFDYEAWLFRRAIRATGYVRTGAHNQPLNAQSARYDYVIDTWRARLAQGVHDSLPNSPFAGVFAALSVGVRSGIDDDQWQVLLDTGTNHLMAISGLHVGLIASLAFVAVRRVWTWWPMACAWWPAPKAAALAALVSALMYAALAGFSIPTQRAFIMVGVVALTVIMQRFHTPSRSLALALLVVLIVDPLAVEDVGFWLSFSAVAAILFVMGGRLRVGGLWWQWGRVHFAIAIALLPLLLLMFQQASLIGPVANLVAVPVVGLIVTPLVLAGVALLVIQQDVAVMLLRLADGLFGLLWRFLQWCADLPFALVVQPMPAVWVALPAVVGVAWLLAPRGVPGRWVGGCLVAAAFLLPVAKPPHGEAWFTLLDVGQGLAAVVETRSSVLVYDTGPRFSATFDTGEAVVVPFLRHRGREAVDMLVISHGDNDHIGGAASVLEKRPVTRILTSVPEAFERGRAEVCRRGQRWQWDGVEFEVLHPSDVAPVSENDGSCVLKVAAGGATLLLTGDIEAAAEHALTTQNHRALVADVLVVPHHGSRTSSTQSFVAAVNPRYALVPVGFANRYRLPNEAVMARYDQRDAVVMESWRHGAIQLRLGGELGVSAPVSYRLTAGRYWHRGAE